MEENQLRLHKYRLYGQVKAPEESSDLGKEHRMEGIWASAGGCLLKLREFQKRE